MARPKSFNTDEALEAALMTFWEKGYDGTSYEDLVQRTGVSRASLYNTFGDKRAMFLTVLKEYSKQMLEEKLKHLDAPDAKVADIISYYEGFTQALEELPDRCLFCDTMHELTPTEDDELKNVLLSVVTHKREVFANAIRNSIKAGEYPADTNVDELIAMLFTQTIGIATLQKSQLVPDVVEHSLRFIISHLKRKYI